MRYGFGCCAIGAAVVTASASADVLYVDGSAPGPADGTSWPTAFVHLQDALDVASNGDEIRIADGIHHPDRSASDPSGSGDRSATFAIPIGVVLMGGYAGFGAADPDERDPSLYPTTLSGQLDSDRSLHVVSLDGRGSAIPVVINGVRITKGLANEIDSIYPDERGGGILAINVNMHLVDVVLHDNNASSFDADGGGGAIYAAGGVTSLVGCELANNDVFSASAGGGAILQHGGTIELTDTTITGSDTGGRGGAVFALDLDGFTIVRCTVTDNRADGPDGDFGAMFLGGSGGRISTCRFESNSAEFAVGGVEVDGGVVFVTNSLFVNNGAFAEGAFYDHDGLAVVTNSTFVDNDVSFDAILAAGTIRNCVFVENGSNSQLIAGDTVSNCVLQEAWGGAGSNNVVADPLLGPDHRPMAGSPAIDLGATFALPDDEDDLDADGNVNELLSRDLDDEARVQDAGGRCPGLVDAGAFEFAGVPSDPRRGDVDESGTVDVDDLIALLSTWGPCLSCCPADFNADGVVGVDDLLTIFALWD